MCCWSDERDNDKEVVFGNPSCSSDMNLNTLVLLLRFETSQVPGGVPEAPSSPGPENKNAKLFKIDNISRVKMTQDGEEPYKSLYWGDLI